MRPAHANALRTKAFGPLKAVAAKDFEAAIAQWEAVIERYERTTGEKLPPAHFRMSLEDMCPERLRNSFRDFSERWPTSEDVRQEIMDGVAEEASRAPKAKAIGAVGAPEAEEAAEEWDETYVFDTVSEQWICGLAPKRPRQGEAADGEAAAA